MVFNATVSNILTILCMLVLVVVDSGVPGEIPQTCHKSLASFIT